jgi:glycosyltransferase involved in cell wall biosynthesis
MVWREADYVLPVTDVLADFVRRAGAPESRIQVIQNGVNRAEFSLRPSEREAARARLGLGSAIVLGFIGFLRPWHGLRSAVDLVADLGGAQDVKLLVIGDGPARADLEAHARTRGVAHLVKVLGGAPRAEVPALLSAADIALQPNVTPYASPLKLFEYMALGRAIVAPDQPNIREIVSDGAEALLFDPGEPRSLYAAVERLCLDAALRERLGVAASAAIERRGFLWERNAQRVVALAQEASSELPAAAD